jgi:hypothetical protein
LTELEAASGISELHRHFEQQRAEVLAQPASTRQRRRGAWSAACCIGPVLN